MAGLSEQEQEFLSDARTGLILCLTGIYLVLSWVFASWTRPLVVMAIISFGLVGTIWGHYVWQVPLSMFTVVGLLGMTGIIINDSIVLITTIDEYAKDRGLIPSIIEATSDLLRPVMLTTLTTVLGLTPLLYEQSQQAQFLKPTVITLVYGLGFGVGMVLLVVPALCAIQRDTARPFTALRRVLSRGGARLRLGVAGTFLPISAWFAGTMGWVLFNGSIHPTLAQLLPQVETDNPLRLSMMLFIAGALVLTLVVYAVSALSYALARRKSRARSATSAT